MIDNYLSFYFIFTINKSQICHLLFCRINLVLAYINDLLDFLCYMSKIPFYEKIVIIPRKKWTYKQFSKMHDKFTWFLNNISTHNTNARNIININFKKGVEKMAKNTGTNQILVPEARQALDQMKTEIASELGMTNYDSMDKGNLPSRQNGYVGGYMTKKLVETAQRNMAGGTTTR
jgi:hypothetical protein